MIILTRTLKDRRVPLFWWALGLLVYCGFIVAVWPVIDGNDEFEELYSDMPDALAAMMGTDGFAGFTTPTGFLTVYLFSMILPFILTGLSVSWGSALIAGEEESGLLDLVLSYPVARRRLLSEKALAIVVALVAMGAVTAGFLAVMREPVNLDVGIDGLAAAMLGSVLFALFHGLLALGAGTFRGSKGLATGLGWGVALVGYLFNVVANIDESLNWLEWASPMYWATADNPIEGTVPATYLLLAGVSAAVFFVSLISFERHDLT